MNSKIRLIALLVIVAVITCEGISRADLTVGKFLSNSNDKQSIEYQLMTLYINGIGDGFMAVNAQLSNAGKKGVYCMPGNLNLDSINYIQLIEDYFKKHPNRRDSIHTPVSFIFLEALIETFPCP